MHLGLGMSGALTNGVVRDLDDHAPGFPVVAGSVGPSHMFVHVTEIDTPVRIFNLDIRPGKLIHADRHGAIIIPEEILPDLGQAIETMLKNEKIIVGPDRQADFDIDKLIDAWRVFEAARV